MDRVQLPDGEIIDRYQAGESVKALADSFGVARNAIDLRLRRAGIEPRNQSEAERLKWSRMSPEQRAAQVEAAHRAVSGSTLSWEAKLARARTRERQGWQASGIGQGEVLLALYLHQRGIKTVSQQAVGPYNCDLGAAPVAVEVWAGNWHWHGNHARRAPERIRHFIDAGWHLLIVHVWPKAGWPLDDGVADYVAAYIKAARRNPARRREYRVIRGAGDVVAVGSVDDDKLSIEWALGNGRDPATGRYQRVPR